MAYTRNRPLAAELLSDSQPVLLQNTNGADDSFDIDHYAFSDTTGNSGKHQVIQTPDQSSDPSTTTDPKTYGLSRTNLPVLLYNRGVSDAVPTPITCLHSSAALLSIPSLGSLTVFTFTSVNYCMGYLQVSYTTAGSPSAHVISGNFMWLDSSNRTASRFLTFPGDAGVDFSFSGDSLNITNNVGAALSNVMWTLSFSRVQV